MFYVLQEQTEKAGLDVARMLLDFSQIKRNGPALHN